MDNEKMRAEFEGRAWQPIETAPVNLWLLFLDGNGVMRYAANGQRHHVDMRLSGPDIGSTANAYMHCYTHWMPLPKPPAE